MMNKAEMAGEAEGTVAPRRRYVKGVGLLLAASMALVACGGDDSDEGAGDSPGTTGATGTTAAGAATTAAASSDEEVTVRLGYFPNITHATAIVGVNEGIFEEKLGSNVKLETTTFNAGPAAIEALFADAIDASYIGPNPAINGYAQSGGDALRIVSGATSGGAFLVVKPEITSAADLEGKKIATPQLGNTQDVALRAWLKERGFSTDVAGGGDVSVVPQENAQTLETFKAGQIDGAWLPEPWATRLIQDAGAKVLIDERSLWPDGKYVTTHLIVATEFLDEHPDVVKHLLEGQVAANEFVNDHPDEAKTIVNDGINALTGKPLSDALINGAWGNLTFTNDPVASSLLVSAEHAEELDLLDPVDLDGIYSLDLLNEVLAGAGEPQVAAA